MGGIEATGPDQGARGLGDAPCLPADASLGGTQSHSASKLFTSNQEFTHSHSFIHLFTH